MELLEGSILSSRYKITKLLRKGGMGSAYLAVDLNTGTKVAVKQLSSDSQTEEERRAAIADFLTEMGVMKRLRHPQIPRILDHFVEPNGFFFILDYIEGENLTTLLEQNGREGFSEEWVIEVGIQVCHVLSYLHEQKPPILHRDIKPSNLVYLEQARKIMVLDFGISRAGPPKAGFTLGTLGYMAPEQRTFNRPSVHSDIYSLGATLHELSTGQRPEEEQFISQSPRDYRPELSESFSNAIMKAIAFEAKDRYPDVKTFLEALQELLPHPIQAASFSAFEEGADRYYQEYLLPQLRTLQKDYPNECQTHAFPHHLSRVIFTLGNEIPYSLIVEAHPNTQDLSFSLKEGLLSPILLGRFSPLETWSSSQKLIDEFLQRYQDKA